MLMAIATKTGLAAGVDLATLRPYVQEGLMLSGPAASGPSTSVGAVETAAAAGTGAVVEPELGQEALAEIKTVVMLVRWSHLQAWRHRLHWPTCKGSVGLRPCAVQYCMDGFVRSNEGMMRRLQEHEALT